ncbi:MAG: RNA polymerase sigma factor [Opitutaceae bacterium]|nr:RNA polymerase sigma factor [Opitutaceae bacterium]
MPSSKTEETRWFAEHVQPHEPALRAYLRSHFPALDTDDLVQESYLRLIRIRAVGKIASTKAYVFTVARNTAHRLFRRRRLYSETPVNELPALCLLDERQDAADTANTHHRLALAVEAIDGLPARCREVVRLVALEGCSYAEVAERLGLSEATVRVQMARGLARCIEFLRECGERS